MKMADGPRQILAAAVGSVAFLALFFGAQNVWWLALSLAVSLYVAVLLLIKRKRPLEEIKLTGAVSAADIDAAARALAAAADRLSAAADGAGDTDRAVLAEMAEHVRDIRQNILDDPEDYRPARSFINVHLPKIVTTVETYVKLARTSKGMAAERLTELGGQIRAYAPVIARIHEATVENDLRALEVEVSALSTQLERR